MRPQINTTEDNINGKILDKDLMKKLLVYLKPYWRYLVVSFIILLAVAAAELAMPAITRYAVDEFITANRNVLVFDQQQAATDFVQKYPKLDFSEYNNSESYYLSFSHNKRNFIAEQELDKLLASDRLYEKTSFLENNPQNRETLQGADYLQVSADLLAIEAVELQRIATEKNLDSSDMRQLQNRNISKLKLFGAIYLAILLLQFLFNYLQIFFINYSSQHAMYDLRRDLFSHLSKMPLKFYDTNPVGRLVTRVTNDVRTLDEMLSNGLVQLIQEFVVLGGIVVMMLIFNWRLALVTFTILPITYVMFRLFMRRSRIIYREVRRRVANINASLAENISGVTIIQLFNQLENKRQQFAKINQQYYEKSMDQLRLFAFFRPIIGSMRRVTLAIILWYGGGQILDNVISLGVFIAFTSYLDRFFEPINRLSEKFNIMQAAMSGIERIFDLMEKTPEDTNYNPLTQKQEQKNLEASDQTGLEKFSGEIEFKNVTMAYNQGEDVLKNISFKVKPGEKVALVGHTGSGKTSIISLLSGLYPYQQGQILVDGKEIKNYSLARLRSNIGIVQQDVFMFSGTIRENIVLNNQAMLEENVQQVARYVNVDKFIESLPEKYDEPVMERGSTFSVGQRQLMAFARVLAYNPSIFVLDEATSNIDTETEILIQDALKKVMQDRTSIIIAHRLSTIQHVDRIIVLHKGKIVESGNHQELLAKEGLYYDLYRLQYA
jgi:ATP-binding cassette subfamily B protein/subfamily B ATP-binding cassette protein MsbA